MKIEIMMFVFAFGFCIGAVAAMAEPPQIEDPTPIKVLIFESMCIAL